MDFSKLLDGSAFWAAVGIIVTQAANTVYQNRKAKLDSALASRQHDTADREAAFKQLLEVVNTLRADMLEMRLELDQERELRKAAESHVRRLRDELHALRNEMQRQGMKIPAPPMGDPAV